MIDLHTHILPEIDDGASSVEEALLLTEMLLKQGVHIAVCTPHFDPAQVALQDFLRNRKASMTLMRASKVKLISGSETMLHEYLFHYTDLSELCIENTKYLLVELPYSKRWDKKVYEAVDKLINHYDLIPVIAHIERYPAVIKSVKHIERLINLGCIIQVNTSSILEKDSMRRVVFYMKHGFIGVLGSDCHNIIHRPPIITAAMDYMTQEFGVRYSNELKYNAECIVKGIEVRKKISFIIE
jgi:protein-tyrosine phosphatase